MGSARKVITVTNDGATILKSIWVDNPAAKILIDISKTQDEEVGDGTTTVAVMAGELLKEAEKLVNQKIHPQIIIQGWRAARTVAQKVLNDISMDHFTDKASFAKDLKNIALPPLSSKTPSSQMVSSSRRASPLDATRPPKTAELWSPTLPWITIKSKLWALKLRSTP